MHISFQLCFHLSKTLNTSKISKKSMKERIEDLVKLSPKGQIVIPKALREKLRIVPGEKLLVLSKNDEIILKKIKKLSIEEIAERVEAEVKKEKIDVDKLISEAIEWARKLK